MALTICLRGTSSMTTREVDVEWTDTENPPRVVVFDGRTYVFDYERFYVSEDEQQRPIYEEATVYRSA